MTRVIVSGQDPLARHRLEGIFESEPQVGLIRVTPHLEEAITFDRADASDVVVVELREVGALAQHLAQREEGAAAPPILVLCPPAQFAAARRLIGQGVRGILATDASPRELLAAVDAANLGLLVLGMEVYNTTVPSTSRPVSPPLGHAAPLSPREREILALVAEGLANKVVAARLGISEHTVKTHVTSIFTKLGAESRAEAVARGVRTGALHL